MSLLVRADADQRLGAGHVMRCLALGQAWQDAGGRVIFGMATPAPALQQRLQTEGFTVMPVAAVPGSPEDAKQTMALAQPEGVNHIVLDGYHFDGAYQRSLKEAGFKLLLLDDYGHADHYYTDIVLNQNMYAHEGYYRKRECYTHLLLGSKYVLLRREFLKWRSWQRSVPEVAGKILVTMGGGDPSNVTLKALKAIKQIPVSGLEVVAVTGAVNPPAQELKAELKNSHISIKLKNNVPDMPELMAWADVAVSAGGSTCWELAFMGLSNCIIILAPNQIIVAETLQQHGLAANAGWYETIDQDILAGILEDLIKNKAMRLKMGTEGRKLVDGQGSQSVVAFLKAL